MKAILRGTNQCQPCESGELTTSRQLLNQGARALKRVLDSFTASFTTLRLAHS